MTVQELYQNINGDYDQAVRVMRVDKLIDKHIRRFPGNGVVDKVLEAGESLTEDAAGGADTAGGTDMAGGADTTVHATELFEAAHAMKGVCANLGLTVLADAASELTEEFRPGNERKLSDAEVKSRIENIREIYTRTVEGIRRYEEA